MIEFLVGKGYSSDKGGRSDDEDETDRFRLLPNQFQQIKYVCGIE